MMPAARARTPSTIRMITRNRDAALISGLPHGTLMLAPQPVRGLTTWLPGPSDVRHGRSRADRDAVASALRQPPVGATGDAGHRGRPAASMVGACACRTWRQVVSVRLLGPGGI